MSFILKEAPWWFDDFETEYCQFCSDQEVCVLEPEEIEDECPKLRASSQRATK